MSGVGTFLRTCPSCGHKFHVKLEGEKLVNAKSFAEPVDEDDVESDGIGGRIAVGPLHDPPIVHEKGVRTTEIRDYEDSFKCEKCGHEWVEKREVEDES